MQITTIGLDIAKHVFYVYGVDTEGKKRVSKVINRQDLLTYFAQLPPCLIGMEACASSHYWYRCLSDLGHEVKLINPSFVTPYVRGNKTDARDAEAICEAVSRPSMRFVPAKSIEQQDMQIIHRVRARQIKQRTALVNQIRGLLGEYGLVIPLGIGSVRKSLPLILEDGENELSVIAREIFSDLYTQLTQLDQQVSEYDIKIKQRVKQNESCVRLQGLKGVGPMIATALVMCVGDGRLFHNGRHMAAYLGLVPKQHSSGGKTRLQGISKRGDRYVRSLLVHGARSVARRAQHDRDAYPWLHDLIERRGMNKAVVAMANKLARQAWVVLARGEPAQGVYAS